MLYECSGKNKIKNQKKNLFERKLNFQNKVTSTKKEKENSRQSLLKVTPPLLLVQPSGVTNIKSHKYFHNIHRHCIQR